MFSTKAIYLQVQMTDRNPRNIVLICLDSVREDYFRRFATRIQKRSDIIYSECRAASGWSVPSHASMFTGQLPHQHGVHVHNQCFSDIHIDDTFLSDLPHYSSGVSANTYASSAFGFDKLFDSYTDISPNRRFPEGMDVARFGKDCDKDGLQKYAAFIREAIKHKHPALSLANGVFDRIDEWLTEAPLPKLLDDGADILIRELQKEIRRASEPFFIFANFMDAHSPYHHVYGYDKSLHSASVNWSSSDYDTHEVNTADNIDDFEEDLRKTREIYAATIDYLDRKINSFLDFVLNECEYDTSIVITADHGENLGLPGDRGMVGHRGSMSEGLLHVPLTVINAPCSTDRVIDEYVSHLLLPGLLSGLAYGSTPSMAKDPVISERVGSLVSNNINPTSEEGRYWGRMIRVMYHNGVKYQWSSTNDSQSYVTERNDKPNFQVRIDEEFNPNQLDKSHFETSINDYKKQAKTMAEKTSIDEVTRDRLEQLGYV